LFSPNPFAIDLIRVFTEIVNKDKPIILRHILETYQIDPTQFRLNGMSILDYSIYRNKIEIIKIFVEKKIVDLSKASYQFYKKAEDCTMKELIQLGLFALLFAEHY
jgi:hypothetical protein